MKYLQIEEVFVFYDEPQLFLGKDGKNVRYICLAVPDNQPNTYICSAVNDDMLEKYLSENVDLRHVFNHPKNYKWHSINLNDSSDGRYVLSELLGNIPDEWLPERGFFASSHTEISKSEVQNSNQTIEIPIDGRWDVQDLAYFPKKFADTYSFLYALRDRNSKDVNYLKNIFQRYPWKGGYSYVGFFNDIYNKIPRKNRLTVKEFQYASPGKILLNADAEIAKHVYASVTKVNANIITVKKVYAELQKGMTERKFLGASKYDVTLTESDINFLKTHTLALSNAIGFKDFEKINELTDNDLLTSTKILTSYYRRLEDLAEFYDSGKASIGI